MREINHMTAYDRMLDRYRYQQFMDELADKMPDVHQAVESRIKELEQRDYPSGG